MEAGFFRYVFRGSGLSIGLIARFFRFLDGLGITGEARGDAYNARFDDGDRNCVLRLFYRDFDVFLGLFRFIDTLFRLFYRRFLD